MKSIILAGGRGDRLWPLSRTGYPKQFISLKGGYSLFQETVARNIPFCDEFLIVSGISTIDIVKNQMAAFRETTYRLLLEERPIGTGAALIMASLHYPPSEILYVMPSHLRIGSDGYKESLLASREIAGQEKIAASWLSQDMLIFNNGKLQNEIKKHFPVFFKRCEILFKNRKINEKGSIVHPGDLNFADASEGSDDSAVTFGENSDSGRSFSIGDILEGIRDEISNMVENYPLQYISVLADLKDAGLTLETQGESIVENCQNTDIYNQAADRLVVVSGVNDIDIVNTGDAVLVTGKGADPDIGFLREKYPSIGAYFDRSYTEYRSWGYYETITKGENYRVNKIVMNPGHSTLSHVHEGRSETWTVASGKGLFAIGDTAVELMPGESCSSAPGESHFIENVGKEQLVIIETAMGSDIVSSAVIGEARSVRDTQGELFVRLKPSFKDSLWGGVKLRDIYKKRCDYEHIAESWELSAHRDGPSVVTTGRYRGCTFQDYLETIGREKWGWKCRNLQNFPLLVKFIDAVDDLSIQVHPGDEYALLNENEYGKNEMWYIAQCDEDSFIYMGFSQDTSREEVAERIKNNTIVEILNKVRVKAGDVFFIPSGTIHAIGAGCFVCEIQQSSNITYRIYDYERRDKYGNSRELHIDKALDVLNYTRFDNKSFCREETINNDGFEKNTQLSASTGSVDGVLVSKLLGMCKYFETRYYKTDDSMELELTEESFTSLVFLEGNGRITGENGQEITFWSGDSIFVCAGRGNIVIHGPASFICTRV